MIDPQEYEQWNSFLDPEDLLIEQINKIVNLKDKDVLEIGCKTGRISFKLEGYTKLTAIEKSKEFIELCKKKNNGDKIQFMQSEAGSMPFEDASFDLVIVSSGLRDHDSIGNVMWNISRILKPKGVLLIIEESGLGTSEDVKTIAYAGYKKMIRMKNNDLKRQLNRFFSKIEQKNLYIPQSYPDLETALKWIIFEITQLNKKTVENKEELEKELEKFTQNTKINLNKGIILLKVT